MRLRTANWLNELGFSQYCECRGLTSPANCAFRGSHGLRDAGLLASAVFRAEQKAHYDSKATVATIGASLGWGLIKNHAFIDGNKRIGLACLISFLKLNGYVLPV